MENNDQENINDIPYSFEEKVFDLQQNGYRFAWEAYIREAYRIFRENPGHFIVYSGIWLLLMGLFNYFFTSPMNALSGVVSAPLFLGYGAAVIKLREDGTLRIADFLAPFDRFVELLLGVIVTSILVAIGFVLLVIPGIFLAFALILTPYFIYFERQGFWEAIRGSRRVVQKKWFSFFVFLIVLSLINVLGVLVFYVGLFVTMPITGIAMFLAYEDVFHGTGNYV